MSEQLTRETGLLFATGLSFQQGFPTKHCHLCPAGRTDLGRRAPSNPARLLPTAAGKPKAAPPAAF